MVQINFAQKQVSAKIVYYGPGMSGKTTNLEIIHQRAPEQNKGELTSISTDGDRTLFFDFMPLDLGTVAGMKTSFQIYTVPGQVYYNSTRKLVLQGVDGVVFVADSSAAMMQENLESLRNLEENLNEYGKSLASIAHVIQYNKRDLPDALSVEELNQHLNSHGAPSFEAIANTGQGVFPTLKALAARVLETIHANSANGGRGAAPAPRAQPQPQPQPLQQPQPQAPLPHGLARGAANPAPPPAPALAAAAPQMASAGAPPRVAPNVARPQVVPLSQTGFRQPPPMPSAPAPTAPHGLPQAPHAQPHAAPGAIPLAATQHHRAAPGPVAPQTQAPAHYAPHAPQPHIGHAPQGGHAPQSGHAPAPGYAPAPGNAPAQGYAPAPGHAQAQGYAPAPGHAPAQGYAPAPGHAQAQGYAPAYAPAPGHAPQQGVPQADWGMAHPHAQPEPQPAAAPVSLHMASRGAGAEAPRSTAPKALRAGAVPAPLEGTRFRPRAGAQSGGPRAEPRPTPARASSSKLFVGVFVAAGLILAAGLAYLAMSFL